MTILKKTLPLILVCISSNRKFPTLNGVVGDNVSNVTHGKSMIIEIKEGEQEQAN